MRGSSVNNFLSMQFAEKYWIPVFSLLEAEIDATIVNPKWAKSVKGNEDLLEVIHSYQGSGSVYCLLSINFNKTHGLPYG